jgi:hypothetical protein
VKVEVRVRSKVIIDVIMDSVVIKTGIQMIEEDLLAIEEEEMKLLTRIRIQACRMLITVRIGRGERRYCIEIEIWKQKVVALWRKIPKRIRRTVKKGGRRTENRIGDVRSILAALRVVIVGRRRRIKRRRNADLALVAVRVAIGSIREIAREIAREIGRGLDPEIETGRDKLN